ncbi:MAG TPA: hypothetical protein VMT94_05625 [Burkholderiales bacterium]|nr:hypothetical protein [Burkholderiales bacterium]
MSTAQNLAYAVIQVAHNLGAATTVGSAIAGAMVNHGGARRALLRALLAGWSVQAVSGIAFGATSLYFYGHPPDIAGAALLALYVKMFCVTAGFAVVGYAFITPPGGKADRIWPLSAALAITALTTAAFLRWFS